MPALLPVILTASQLPKESKMGATMGNGGAGRK